MPNSFTPFNPTTWSRIMVAILREKCVMPGLINRDFEPDFANPGDTVNTRKPGKFVSNPLTMGNDIVRQDATATNIPIVLNNHEHVAFDVFDVEQSKSINQLIELYMDPAMLAIAKAVDTSILARYVDFTALASSASAGGLKTAINNARTRLNKNLVPEDNRYLVLSDDDEGALAGIAQFERSNETPTAGVTGGAITRIKGFQQTRSSNVASVGSPAQRRNMALHRNAITLAVRPLPVTNANGVTQIVRNEPDAGLSIRFTTGYDINKLRNTAVVDTVWGVKTLDAALAFVLPSTILAA
ncbi:Major capsid protein Gp5 [uncultured Caudovirales phage]|jgi:hypothetical protein|uniref:Major capsid protein Gp5 n=1 Tax=uncultured Caudovirales phage TaxID=2100421 RepID=A0A6J5LYP6_9CAUD|nr:Major capsid protein Gp5 [uncultured Caudovirales phage]